VQDDGPGRARLDQDALGQAQVKTRGRVVCRDGCGSERGERLRLRLRLSLGDPAGWWRGPRRGDQRREGAIGEVDCDTAAGRRGVRHGS
jgi:hypothetical protein